MFPKRKKTRRVKVRGRAKDRPQRDFLEKSKSAQRQKFISYLNDQGIYFPGNGIIFFNYSLRNAELNYLIDKFKKGLKKYF